MRYGLRSSLKATYTIHNLGFVAVLQVVATGYTGAGAEGSAADAVARALIGFANAMAIGTLVARALGRAGVEAP